MFGPTNADLMRMWDEGAKAGLKAVVVGFRTLHTISPGRTLTPIEVVAIVNEMARSFGEETNANGVH